ncbi:hypothetical protein D9615_006367 [Tricholomella constricta]|uniref:Uncharacterized protein n=1 Tax=Tricholomella constricta TaxID=117010 RepID=A0A8H5M0Z1_9AGAR|nr:hypothetical protein D9615_006367 [Tricholomella constricta]
MISYGRVKGVSPSWIHNTVNLEYRNSVAIDTDKTGCYLGSDQPHARSPPAPVQTQAPPYTPTPMRGTPSLPTAHPLAPLPPSGCLLFPGGMYKHCPPRTKNLTPTPIPCPHDPDLNGPAPGPTPPTPFLHPSQTSIPMPTPPPRMPPRSVFRELPQPRERAQHG